MAKILIVDDDITWSRMLTRVVEKLGHEAFRVTMIHEAIKCVESDEYDLVCLDVKLPDGDGLEFLPQIKSTLNHPEIIIMTAYGDTTGAELAIKSGAWDYIEKGGSIAELSLPVQRAVEFRREKMAHQSNFVLNRINIVGNSPQMQSCLALVSQAANSDAPALIQGETGTGKELLARAIHDNSLRANGNFVIVDCTALPESLVESLLFGYKKGTFTGAEKSRDGLLQQANGGTLFLDEIGDMPFPMQGAILRVLQEGTYRQLGAKEEVKSDFRIISATNQDLNEMINKGKFRLDLYYRLCSFKIDTCPLRDRREDIKELALYHANTLCARQGVNTKGFSPDTLHALEEYPWPGNVRELFLTISRAIAAAGEAPTIFPVHLPPDIRVKVTRLRLDKSAQNKINVKSEEQGILKLKDFRDESILSLEKTYLINLMSIAKGSINKACKLSGVSRSRLYTLLRKHHIATR